MSKVRKAHSVELIERRLRDAEASPASAMELIGLHDELARVERKWREQMVGGESDRRRPGDVPRLNEYFDRLARQVEACLRAAGGDPAERALLERMRAAIAERSRT